MNKFIFFLSLIVFVASCGNAPEKSDSKSQEDVVVAVNDFYANPDNYIGTEVTLKGMVTHVCKHGGQKLFVAGGEDGKTLRIDVGETIPEFKIEMEGTEAVFTGKIELIGEVLASNADAEHAEHHSDEESAEECEHEKDKTYHMIATSFRPL